MMRTRAGSSLLPAPVLAKATHWEEGAMTNPDIAHTAIPHASDGDTGLATVPEVRCYEKYRKSVPSA